MPNEEQNAEATQISNAESTESLSASQLSGLTSLASDGWVSIETAGGHSWLLPASTHASDTEEVEAEAEPSWLQAAAELVGAPVTAPETDLAVWQARRLHATA